MNQADLYVMPSERCSWWAEMPFFDPFTSANASTHLFSGILLSSMTVPTVTVNGFSQALHLYTPGRVLLPSSLRIFSTEPQCGQTGPLGQCSASRCSRALFASV